ncbi:MAG: hypothetical protein ABIJ57_03345 [Pseudomonadota bacterium]
MSDVDSATKNMQASIDRIAWTGVAVAATAATAAIVIGFKKSLDASSDLNETVSKSNTIFGQSAAEMMKWAGTSATAMGMSKQAALENAGTMGNMFAQLGAGTEIAAKNSKSMVQLSADIASFHNVTGGAEAVLQGMMSAFRGEYDSLQRYIPTIKAASVEQLALSETGKSSAKELTELEKATAAMHLIMRDAGAATGDFARTSGELANQQRVLEANVKNTFAAIGDGLRPMVTILYREVNAWFNANQNIIKQKLPEYVLYTADALALALIGVRSFHNAWLGIKLVGATTLAALNTALYETFRGFRAILAPLDLMYIGMMKMGLVDANPFDNLQNALNDWKLASYDVTRDIANDIVPVNQGYEKVLGRIIDMRSELTNFGKVSKETSATITNQVKDQKTATEQWTKAQQAELDKALTYAKQVGRETYRSYALTQDDMTKYHFDMTELRYKEEQKAAKEKEKIDKKAAETEKKLIADRLNAYRDMYGDMTGFVEQNFEIQIELLDQQAEKYLELGAANNAVDEWYNQKWEQLNRERILASNDFFAGMRVGFQRNIEEMKTWAEMGQEIVLDFAGTAKNTISDVLFDGITGELKSLEDYWDSAWKSMARSATDKVADVATSTLTSLAGSAIGAVGSWLFAEKGDWNVQPEGGDTMAVLAHKGEMVVPQPWADAMREAIGTGGGLGSFGEGGFSSGDFGEAMSGPDTSLTGLGLSQGEIAGIVGGVIASFITSSNPVSATLSLGKSAYNIGLMSGTYNMSHVINGAMASLGLGLSALAGMEGLTAADANAIAASFDSFDAGNVGMGVSSGGGPGSGFGEGGGDSGFGGDYLTGTGPGGLPKTGTFRGHAGEVVLNPKESEVFNRWMSGGHDGGGPMNITIIVGGEEFDAIIKEKADGVRVEAERRNMGIRRLY